MEMPAARRFPGLELSFPLLARLRRRLYTVSGGLGPGPLPRASSTSPRGRERDRERPRDPFSEGFSPLVPEECAWETCTLSGELHVSDTGVRAPGSAGAQAHGGQLQPCSVLHKGTWAGGAGRGEEVSLGLAVGTGPGPCLLSPPWDPSVLGLPAQGPVQSGPAAWGCGAGRRVSS